MKNLKFLTFICLIVSVNAFAQDNLNSEINRTIIQQGVGLGSVIAAVTSWERNKSILLAIIHGIFSWLYVIYFALTRKEMEQ